ncbi:hypothetical protein Bbelb_045730 [Branchiostoma belcheri]|nr:hypothetical protein Bbelb_045730 [Branchiostoma belcheri]
MIPAKQTTSTAKNARLIRRMAMPLCPGPRRRLVGVAPNRRGAGEVLPVPALPAPSGLLVRSGPTTMKSSSGTGRGHTRASGLLGFAYYYYPVRSIQQDFSLGAKDKGQGQEKSSSPDRSTRRCTATSPLRVKEPSIIYPIGGWEEGVRADTKYHRKQGSQKPITDGRSLTHVLNPSRDLCDVSRSRFNPGVSPVARPALSLVLNAKSLLAKSRRPDNTPALQRGDWWQLSRARPFPEPKVKNCHIFFNPYKTRDFNVTVESRKFALHGWRDGAGMRPAGSLSKQVTKLPGTPCQNKRVAREDASRLTLRAVIGRDSEVAVSLRVTCGYDVTSPGSPEGWSPVFRSARRPHATFRTTRFLSYIVQKGRG